MEVSFTVSDISDNSLKKQGCWNVLVYMSYILFCVFLVFSRHIFQHIQQTQSHWRTTKGMKMPNFVSSSFATSCKIDLWPAGGACYTFKQMCCIGKAWKVSSTPIYLDHKRQYTSKFSSLLCSISVSFGVSRWVGDGDGWHFTFAFSIFIYCVGFEHLWNIMEKRVPIYSLFNCLLRPQGDFREPQQPWRIQSK